MKRSRFAAVCLVTFASVGFAQVRTFVATTGFDTNPCSRTQPCRNFGPAVAAVVPNGEVVALDSGGYGAVAITKPVSLIAPEGVHVGIAPTTGSAIYIATAAGDHVDLRNLFLKSQGALQGIRVDAVGTLYIDHCTVSGFDYGIRTDSSGSHLYVSHSTVRRSSTIGVNVVGETVRATLDSVQLQRNVTGLYVSGAEATIRDSVASGSGLAGFWAADGSKVMIENSVATNNATGFNASGASIMTLMRSAATSNNAAGIQAGDDGTTIYVSESTIAANELGVLGFLDGVVLSRGDNTLRGNTTEGTFSSTFTPN